MRRASIIVIVPFVALFAVWTAPVSAQVSGELSASAQTEPAKDKDAAAAKDVAKEIPEINEAFNDFKNRDADGALKVLKKACKKHPEIPTPYIILSRFFAAAKAPVGMRNALEQGVKEFPNDPEAYVNLGDMNYQEQRVTEARLLYEKAASLLPKFDVAARKKSLEIRTLAGLAMTSMAREDWAGAQKEVQAWLKLDPESIEGMQQLAGCLLRQKDVNGALGVPREGLQAFGGKGQEG